MYNFSSLRTASRSLVSLNAAQRTAALHAFAQALESRSPDLLAASIADLAEHGDSLTSASQARLTLDPAKLTQVVAGVRQVAALADPVGTVTQRTLLDDGLILERTTVPLGVFGIIFESRADVMPQILSLALRSANAVVLKGGSETRRINTLYAEIAASIPGLPDDWFQLHHERAVVDSMLTATADIDLIIPRGSNELVQSIIEKSRVPVLGHADGVCHIYVDPSADTEKALGIIVDAKTQYPAACNAVETVLIHRSLEKTFLPQLVERTKTQSIELRGDATLRSIVPEAAAIEDAAWHCEYGEKILAVRVVDSLDAAVDHINTWGSHHTDCIVAEDSTTIELFLKRVDSANVYANCSTRFADGFRYGFGAEIGISTGRIHARGPVGLEGLMTCKYLLRGTGQTVATYTGANPRPFQHSRLL